MPKPSQSWRVVFGRLRVDVDKNESGAQAQVFPSYEANQSRHQSNPL